MARRRNPTNTGNAVVDAASILTQRELASVNAYFQGGLTPAQAIVAGGFSEETARSKSGEILSQPHMQAYMRALLAEVEMPMIEQARILADSARNAQTMIVDKNGEEHFNPDHRTRIEAIRIMLQGTGVIGPRQAEGAAGNTINIYVDQRAAPQEVIDITPDSL